MTPRAIKDSPMLYLKNTLGGLSRSITDSALNSFQGPNRWWKLALFAVLFVLPGGSVGVAILAWWEHRRGRKDGRAVSAGQSGSQQAVKLLAAPASKAGGAVPASGMLSNGSANGACSARRDAPCRAAAGKLARQTKSADTRG
jgi:hypothetical protein